MRLPPFDREGRFFRGNLHCHSTRSDGRLDPEQVVLAYKRLGYDFICLSDHFEAEFGWQVTDTSAWRDRAFTTIIGAELSRPGPLARKWFMLAAGLPLDFAPVADGETGAQLAARARSSGAFVALLHPGFNATTLGDLEHAEFDAVEIYNHGVARMNDRGDGWYLCEGLLDQGGRLSCIASDDAHFTPNGYGTIAGAWLHVRSPALETESLLAALKDGAFYATMGPEIHDVVVDRAEVEIHCSPVDVVAITGSGHRARSVVHRAWDGGRDLTYEAGTVEAAGADGITRCRLPLDGWAPGDWWRVTMMRADGRRAWTNPARVGA
ncbi:MAG: hypothetical protein V7607_5602 [Solirubrobacteraceae bacterium]